MLDNAPTDHSQRANDQRPGAVFVQPATGLLCLQSAAHVASVASFGWHLAVPEIRGDHSPLGVGVALASRGVDGPDGWMQAWRRRNSTSHSITSSKAIPPS